MSSKPQIYTKETSIAIMALIDVGGRIEYLYRSYKEILEYNRKPDNEHDHFCYVQKCELLTIFKYVEILEDIADCVSYDYKTLGYYKLKETIQEDFK